MLPNQSMVPISILETEGWSSVHIASLNGRLDVVQLLISTGTSADIRNRTQTVPLTLASIEGVEVGRFLIERGAEMNVWDNESWGPLRSASGKRTS